MLLLFLRLPHHAGMVTLEMVSAAADDLVKGGHRPSVRAVRRQLGGGSPNVLSAHLRAWRTARQMVPSTETPPSIVAEVAGVAPFVWNAALEAARKFLGKEIERSALDLKAANDHNDELQGILEETTANLDRVRIDRQRDADKARSEREALKVEIERLRGEIAQRDAAAIAREKLLSDANGTIKLQQEQLASVTARISLVQQERDLERSSHRRELGDRDDRLAVVSKDLAEERRLHQAVASVATRTQEELAGVRIQLAAMRTLQDTSRIEHGNEVSQLRDQITEQVKAIGDRDAQVRTLAEIVSRERTGRESAEARARSLEMAGEITQDRDLVLVPILQRLGAIESALQNRPIPPV